MGPSHSARRPAHTLADSLLWVSAASLASAHQPLHLLLAKPLLALPPVILQEVILIITDLCDAIFPLSSDGHA